MITSNDNKGIVWDCGFDDIFIVADLDTNTDLWTYLIRRGELPITTRISSDKAPNEESARGRDIKIKTALSRQKVYVGEVDKVLTALTEFGISVENDNNSISQHIESKRRNLKDIKVSPDNIIDTALDILANGDPINFVLDAFDTMHKGDRETAKLLLLAIATQSILNSDGIQPGVNGESGKGKSHSCETMLHLMPEECWINTSLSAKSIFYSNIQPGTIVFSDDVSIGEDLESTIKRATSNFQKTTTHTTLDTNRKVIELEIPPRISWWLASVDAEMSTQTINRQFGVTIDESPKMDDVVADHQLMKAVDGDIKFPINDDVLICREIMRKIKETLFVVVIPFAKNIVWVHRSNRRNLPIFLDMIKSFAVLRFKQREIDINGSLVATPDDFASAAELYSRRAETQTTKLSDAELKLVRVLSDNGDMDVKTIQKLIGKSETSVRTMLHGKDDRSGLLSKVPGLHKESITERYENRNINKCVYGIDGFNMLSSYEGVVYLSDDVNPPPVADTTHQGWTVEHIKRRVHAYMSDCIETKYYMTRRGFAMVSAKLEDEGAPTGLIENVISHYKDNPNQ